MMKTAPRTVVFGVLLLLLGVALPGARAQCAAGYTGPGCNTFCHLSTPCDGNGGAGCDDEYVTSLGVPYRPWSPSNGWQSVSFAVDSLAQSDEYTSRVVNLPWPFYMYGNRYTMLRIYRPGNYISMGPDVIPSPVDATTLPTSNLGDGPVIIPFWLNWRTQDLLQYLNTVRTGRYSGNGQEAFIIDFSNLYTGRFQVVLFRGTNNIEFHFGDARSPRQTRRCRRFSCVYYWSPVTTGLQKSSVEARVVVDYQRLTDDEVIAFAVRFQPEVDYCCTNPCQNGGVCSSNPSGYTCNCPSNFKGSDCQFPCPNCNSAGGVCVSTGSAAVCSCFLGWLGPLCQYSDALTCNNNGQVDSTGTCTCYRQFTGSNCQQCATGFSPLPSCPKAYTQCTCSCTSGSLCPSSCGSCIQTSASCSCSVTNHCDDWQQTCDIGYLKTTSGCNFQNIYTTTCTRGCLVDTDSCATCNPGFFGRLSGGTMQCITCPTCQNGGTCNDGINGDGTCSCPSGFVGPLCQYSRSLTCSDHGTPDYSGACTCDITVGVVAFAGASCNGCLLPNYFNYPFCLYCDASAKCNNVPGASCSALGDCVCPAGYVGSACESCDTANNYYGTVASGCKRCRAAVECNGHGTCDTNNGNCICTTPHQGASCTTCPAGRFGSTCAWCPKGELVPSNPCHSKNDPPQGLCFDGYTGNGTCLCAETYSGFDCGESVALIDRVLQSTGPTEGGPGQDLWIQGKNLRTSGVVELFFNGQQHTCVPSLWTRTEILCEVPEGNSGTASITVVPTGTSAQIGEFAVMTYTYQNPSVSSLFPNHGRVAYSTPVDINGLNFGANPKVFVDGVEDTAATQLSHRKLRIVIPPGIGTRSIVVSVLRTDGSRQSLPAQTFTYDKPLLTSLAPASGPTTGGTLIMITGENFGAPGQYTVSVTFSGGGMASAPATSVTVLSDSTLTCRTPEGTWEADVAITRNGITRSFAQRFTYDAPIVTDASGCTPSPTNPNATVDCIASGFFTLTLGGFNFGSPASASMSRGLLVRVNGIDCLNPTITVSHRQLTCQMSGSRGWSVLSEVIRGATQTGSARLISFRGPGLLQNTLSFSSDYSPPHQLVSSSTAGNQLIYFKPDFQGLLFDPSKVQVFYGVLDARGSELIADSKYLCVMHTLNDTDGSCWSAPGVGVGLAFQLQLEYEDPSSGKTELYISNINAADSLSYPQPIITPLTIWLPTDQNPERPVDYTDIGVNGVGNQNELLTFSGLHFGTFYDLVSVTYGPPGDEGRYLADLIGNGVTDTTLHMRTSFGEGIDLVFRVSVGPPGAEQVVTGTDRFSYPTAPKVFSWSATGCVNAVCPTNALDANGNNIVITINGDQFGLSGAVAQVGGLACDNLQHVTGNETNQITCALPAGVGENHGVVVERSSVRSDVTQFLSYSPPLVTGIEGCEPVSDPHSDLLSVNCNRDGTSVVNITGVNFGASRARVLIGDGLCKSLSHDPVDPHSRVQCTLPQGTGPSVRVLLVQDKGSLSPQVNLGYRQCQPGTHNDGIECVECRPGRYVDLENQDACFECPRGSFSAQPGAAACDQCVPGTFAASAGMSVCNNCTLGTATNVVGSQQCLSCDPGKFADTNGTVSCTSCAPGRFQVDTGKSFCDNCPVGQAVATPGQFSCSECLPGTFQNETGQTECIQCPGGWIGENLNLPESTKCLPCPKGSFSNFNPTCSPCPAGTSGPEAGLVACVPCGRGLFQKDEGKTTCDQCVPGSIADTNGLVQCRDCAAGTIAPNFGLDACVSCDPGRYQPDAGKSECFPCPRGEAQSLSGQDTCTPCRLGNFADKLFTIRCSACVAGTFAASTGSSFCDICQPGSFAGLAQSSSCTPCPKGSVSKDAQADSCTPCQPGYYAPQEGLSECLACPNGTFSALPSAEKCDLCPSGRAASSEATTECEICPLGKFTARAGLDQCVDCPPGFSSAQDGSIECKPCQVGKFSASPGDLCDLCESGTFASADMLRDHCAICPVGRFSTGGADTCRKCGRGSYQSLNGSDACLPCPIGEHAADLGQSSCTSCPPGRFGAEQGKVTCDLCPLGRFQATPKMSSCDPCDVGKSQSQKGQDRCDPCETGKAMGFTGQAACRPCEKGFFAPVEGADTCIPCAPGSAQEATGGSDCRMCPPGEANDAEGQAFCRQCMPGTFTNASGLVKCDRCEPGRAASSPGSSTCLACDVGRFAQIEGQDRCLECDPGTYTNTTGVSACFFCDAGTFQGASEAIECKPCQAGRFTANVRTAKCGLCLPGKFSNDTGMTACIDCRAGSEQPIEGSTSCVACVAGAFAGVAGQPQCEPCSKGSFNSIVGGTSCATCDDGWFQEDVGQTFCKICGVGSYSPEPTTCKNCEGQSITMIPGQQKCVPCGENSVVGPNRVRCLCEPGWYSDETPFDDIITCIPCPIGSDCTALGTRYETLGSIPGWWRQNNNTLTFYRCQSIQHCAGGESLSCANNRDGPLCSLCKDGYQPMSTGNCGKCPESDGAGPATFAGLAVLLLAASVVLFYFILTADADLMQAIRLEDIHGRAKAERLLVVESFARKQERSKNATQHKFKIIIGFLQITVHIMYALDFPWPQTFKTFIGAFSFANLDLVAFSRAGCVTEINFFVNHWATASIPFVVLVGLVVFYLIPQNILALSERSPDLRAKRKNRVWMKFKKLNIYFLFLAFPRLSSSAFQVYTCQKIEGVSYLKADMSIVCFESYWNFHATLNIFAMVAFPFGIPFLFYKQLSRSKNRGLLQERRVQYVLGFIYMPYSQLMWWFELMDMLHKLLLTSFLGLLPLETQLPLGMIVATTYLIIMLVHTPYFEKSDFALHALAQVEIALVFQAGHVFDRTGEWLNSTSDIIMSVSLIAVVGFFFCVFLSQLWVKVVGVLNSLRESISAMLGKKEEKRQLTFAEIEEELLRQKYNNQVPTFLREAQALSRFGDDDVTIRRKKKEEIEMQVLPGAAALENSTDKSNEGSQNGSSQERELDDFSKEFTPVAEKEDASKDIHAVELAHLQLPAMWHTRREEAAPDDAKVPLAEGKLEYVPVAAGGGAGAAGAGADKPEPNLDMLIASVDWAQRNGPMRKAEEGAKRRQLVTDGFSLGLVPAASSRFETDDLSDGEREALEAGSSDVDIDYLEEDDDGGDADDPFLSEVAGKGDAVGDADAEVDSDAEALAALSSSDEEFELAGDEKDSSSGNNSGGSGLGYSDEGSDSYDDDEAALLDDMTDDSDL